MLRSLRLLSLVLFALSCLPDGLCAGGGPEGTGNWKRVEGKVSRSWLQESSPNSGRHKILINYGYYVDGRPYRRENADIIGGELVLTLAEAEQLLNKYYGMEASINVLYDPLHPESSRPGAPYTLKYEFLDNLKKAVDSCREMRTVSLPGAIAWGAVMLLTFVAVPGIFLWLFFRQILIHTKMALNPDLAKELARSERVINTGMPRRLARALWLLAAAGLFACAWYLHLDKEAEAAETLIFAASGAFCLAGAFFR